MKTILISGAGSGIGRSIAQVLDQGLESPRFILFGRNKKNLENTRHSLKIPKQHQIVSVDQRNAESMRAAFRKLKPHLKNVVAVIANAGICSENQGLDRNWHEIIETNLTGTYRFIQASLPALRASPHTYKHIVIISSTAARSGVPKFAAYSASKAALLGLTRCLAVELAPEKILVNAICPGEVDTPMIERMVRNFSKRAQVSETVTRRIFTQHQLLKKFLIPEEIGRLVAYLVSDSQVSMTGQTMDINNGSLMP